MIKYSISKKRYLKSLGLITFLTCKVLFIILFVLSGFTIFYLLIGIFEDREGFMIALDFAIPAFVISLIILLSYLKNRRSVKFSFDNAKAEMLDCSVTKNEEYFEFRIHFYKINNKIHKTMIQGVYVTKHFFLVKTKSRKLIYMPRQEDIEDFLFKNNLIKTQKKQSQEK